MSLSYYNPFQPAPSTLRKSCPTPMAAIHALPIEILTRIFLLGLPDADAEYPDFPLTPAPPFEVTVSHVCARWRDVALRTPFLWAVLHLRTVPHIDRARAFLARNPRAPLHILVDTCDADEHVPGFLLFRDEFLPVFTLLTPHIARWKSLQIRVRDRQCKLGARQVLSTCGPAPVLEYLQLWHVESWDTSERLFTQIGPPPVVVFDKSLPALKHISLIGVNLPWTHSPFLAGLRSVDFRLHANDVRIPYGLWERMLEQSPGLERIKLHYSGPRGPYTDWRPLAVRLPALKELVLEEMPPAELVALVRRLSAPGLQTLHLNLPALEDGEDATAFVDFLAHPPAPLPLLNPDPNDPKTKEKSSGKGTAAHQDQAQTANSNAEREREKEKDKKPPGPVFPALHTLTLDALDCTPAAFAALLRACASVRHLKIDGRKLGEGLFEELLRVDEARGREEVRVESGSGNGSAREGSAESASSSSSSGTSSSSSSASGPSAASSSTSLPSPAQAPLALAAAPPIPLPHLRTLRIAGVEPAAFRALVRLRAAHGAPVGRWYVGEGMRCAEVEAVGAEMEMEIQARRAGRLGDCEEDGGANGLAKGRTGRKGERATCGCAEVEEDGPGERLIWVEEEDDEDDDDEGDDEDGEGDESEEENEEEGEEGEDAEVEAEHVNAIEDGDEDDVVGEEEGEEGEDNLPPLQLQPQPQRATRRDDAPEAHAHAHAAADADSADDAEDADADGDEDEGAVYTDEEEEDEDEDDR